LVAFSIGERVGDYEILGLVGKGGMGCVYRVRNVISERTEAMKVLLADLQSEPELANRFLREIRTLGTLDHPNIAALHTALQIGNQLLMVMEFVEGMTLQQLRAQSALSPEQVIVYVQQLLAALSFAHDRGVIHRDLKPANIMVTPQGTVKLTDFGIAKSKVIHELTQPGTTMGSLNYMSPEQAGGKGVDNRSDLYSLGITMYEILAGNLPFEDESAYVVLHNQLNVSPRPPIEVNPLLPKPLNDVILKALEKDPENRFQSARSFSEALEQASGIASAASLEPTPMAGRGAPSAAVAGPVNLPTKAAPTSRFRTVNHAKFWLTAEASSAVVLLTIAGVCFSHLSKARVMVKESGIATWQPAPPPAAGYLLVSAREDVETPTNAQPALPQPAILERAEKKTPAKSKGAVSTPEPAVKAPPDNSADKPASHVHAPANSPELQALRDQRAKLNARADAVRTSVQRLKSEREAEGDGLNQEVAGAYVRMNAYLSAGNSDLEDGDISAAREHIEKAASEITVLEGMFTRASAAGQTTVQH
jgi:eukaryotic-like serine/threonine-protein kinase